MLKKGYEKCLCYTKIHAFQMQILTSFKMNVLHGAIESSFLFKWFCKERLTSK